jgi:exopolysaccharide biosynthesis WecB/TagA/CpsF family protein
LIDFGKQNVLGTLVDAVDYEYATEQILAAARARRPFPVACVPVHSVMEGFLHPDHRYRINHFAMAVPDGMPVRWALDLLHGLRLPDRVRGVTLTLGVLARAEREQVGVYFYGNTSTGLKRLLARLRELFPRLRISGMEPSKFRRISGEEKASVVERIRASGAVITFVGLGAPLQDIWAYEYAQEISMPILCVGGAFNVIAGAVVDAPEWMQSHGLEWLYRFAHEPARLWRRYVLLNPTYMCMVALQKLGRSFNAEGVRPETDVRCG